MSQQSYSLQTQEEATAVISALRSYQGRHMCDGWGPYDVTFLPKFSLTRERDKFTLKVWYVCSRCGREI